jgi:SAM-dependent methyltransferase
MLERLGGLQPDHDVLDVGCGIGRVAIPLTDYLSSGTYEGFDVVEEGVRWCAENITPQFPNFGFKFVDASNSQYRPNGASPASEVTFPYDDEQFDLVFLISVFTHLLPDALHRYLSEIARVLRPEGRLVATFFLLTDESREAILGKPQQPIIECGDYQVLSEAQPEIATALQQNDVLEALAAHGFELNSHILRGTWFRQQRCDEGHQDIIAAREALRRN